MKVVRDDGDLQHGIESDLSEPTLVRGRWLISVKSRTMLQTVNMDVGWGLTRS